jgi:hypothetical protein
MALRVALATLALAFAAAPASADIPPGFDLFETDPESTVFRFDHKFESPVDFFRTDLPPGTTPHFVGDPNGPGRLCEIVSGIGGLVPPNIRCAFLPPLAANEPLVFTFGSTPALPYDSQLSMFFCPNPCAGADVGPVPLTLRRAPAGGGTTPPPGGGQAPGTTPPTQTCPIDSMLAECGLRELSQSERERRANLRLDDLIRGNGTFPKPVKLGFGVIVVNGADPAGVNLQGFVVNAHTGPFDLSVFGFEPQPLTAAANSAKAIRHNYKAVKVHLEPGEGKAVALKTPAKLKAALKKALKNRKKVTRKVTMTYKDLATGKSQTVVQRFTVRGR